jgi:hypothetical protein
MHPILLAGAALVGLPVLLHLLLKPEPKRLPFPALRFLLQTRTTSQRKLRLRQVLLLALRCLLVALFALTLFQPRLSGSGLAGLADEQPVAAVFVLDTSPSMGYAVGGLDRLADARQRALELLDELPAGSRVAVIDPTDPAADWEPTPGDARRRIEGFTEPSGVGPPLTAALTAAYQLLRTADDGEPLPKLVAVFTDRATASWAPDRAADLTALAGQVPGGVGHLVVDVGTDAPANVSLLELAANPAGGPAGQPVAITATVRAVGGDVDAEVALSVDDGPPQRQPVRLAAGQPAAVRFTLTDLPVGLHRGRVTVRDDALPADNVRHVTFKVGSARTILTVADSPEAAELWQLAHEAKGEFGVQVVAPGNAADFGRAEFVTLLGLADPGRPLPDGKTLWDRLKPYLDGGGKLLVIPGGDEARPAGYDHPALPGKLLRIVDVARDNPLSPGAAWRIDDAAERQPLLTGFREWRLAGVDFLKAPRRTRKFWETEAPAESVVVRYDEPEGRPAVLEKALPGGGRVVLLTSRLDTAAGEWNDYWEVAGSSFPTVWPHRLAVHLAGSAADAGFTFPTGTAATVALPRGGFPKGTRLALEGPGIGGADAAQPLADGQAEWRLPPALATVAGSFRVRGPGGFEDGFSLNPPAAEFDLTKVPVEAVEAATGPGSVVPVGRAARLADVLESKLSGEVSLFPWLLVAVLVLFAAEGVFANRFYGRS